MERITGCQIRIEGGRVQVQTRYIKLVTTKSLQAYKCKMRNGFLSVCVLGLLVMPTEMGDGYIAGSAYNPFEIRESFNVWDRWM